MNFVQELKWRGMIQDMTPGTEEQLQKELDANEKLRTETVTKTIAGDYLVIFEKNKIELSNEARANLGMLAAVIKLGDPAAVYNITGYADSGTVLVIQCVARAKRACCIPIAEVYERGKKPSSIDRIIM